MTGGYWRVAVKWVMRASPPRSRRGHRRHWTGANSRCGAAGQVLTHVTDTSQGRRAGVYPRVGHAGRDRVWIEERLLRRESVLKREWSSVTAGVTDPEAASCACVRPCMASVLASLSQSVPRSSNAIPNGAKSFASVIVTWGTGAPPAASCAGVNSTNVPLPRLPTTSYRWYRTPRRRSPPTIRHSTRPYRPG